MFNIPHEVVIATMAERTPPPEPVFLDLPRPRRTSGGRRVWRAAAQGPQRLVGAFRSPPAARTAPTRMRYGVLAPHVDLDGGGAGGHGAR